MKKFLPIFFLLIFLSCFKSYDINEMESKQNLSETKEEIKKLLLSTYDYKISIKDEVLDISFNGEKDPLNRFTLKGYFKILDQKNYFDHIFTGREWIKRKDLSLDFGDIFDIPSFIENIIDPEMLNYRSFEKGEYIFDVKVNTALIDPSNYLQDGLLYYDPVKKEILITLYDRKKFQVKISYKKIEKIKFNDRYYKTKIKVFGDKKDLEKLNERFLISDLGKVEKENVFLKFDPQKYIFDIKMLLEDSLSFYTFSYVSPDNESENILYMNFDLRNTVLKEDKILALSGKEFFVEKNGEFYTIHFKDVNLEKDYEMVCKLSKFSFHSKYTKANKTLVIKGLNETVLSVILALNSLPYNFNNIYIKEE
ncbi:MAG: hypothetical protein QME48_05395 [bacterium]|nr:hypothetical protein [bacterium]